MQRFYRDEKKIHLEVTPFSSLCLIFVDWSKVSQQPLLCSLDLESASSPFQYEMALKITKLLRERVIEEEVLYNTTTTTIRFLREVKEPNSQIWIKSAHFFFFFSVQKESTQFGTIHPKVKISLLFFN